MTALVYSIAHRATGREYIGVTSRSLRRRMQQHLASAQAPRTNLHRSIAAHGADAFDVRVEASLPTRAEALIAERIAIALREPAFNMTPGGDGLSGAAASAANLKAWASGKRSRQCSPETRAKMAAARRGRKHSPETCAKIGASQRGRSMPLETRAKLSEVRRGIATRPAGFTYSAESRAKMSASAKARWAKKKGA